MKKKLRVLLYREFQESGKQAKLKKRKGLRKRLTEESKMYRLEFIVEGPLRKELVYRISLTKWGIMSNSTFIRIKKTS